MRTEKATAMLIKAARRTATDPAITRVLVEVAAAEPMTDADRLLFVEILSRSVDVYGAALLLRRHKGLLTKDVRAIGPFKDSPPPPKPDR